MAVKVPPPDGAILANYISLNSSPIQAAVPRRFGKKFDPFGATSNDITRRCSHVIKSEFHALFTHSLVVCPRMPPFPPRTPPYLPPTPPTRRARPRMRRPRPYPPRTPPYAPPTPLPAAHAPTTPIPCPSNYVCDQKMKLNTEHRKMCISKIKSLV